jgi:hypothetical protein
MKRSGRTQALLAVAVLVGCTGGSSTAPVPGAADSGSGLAWHDSMTPPADGATFGTADGTAAPQADLGSVFADGSGGCPFGNLLATLPALPPLCRPCAAPQPSSPPADPVSCQDGAQVVLTAGADQFIGTDNIRDVVSGMDGDDYIKGHGCSDNLNGNQGADELHGNMGADELHGGAGDDAIYAGAGHDSIWGGGGEDALTGGGGDDRFFYAEGNGHDVIHETSGHDTIVCAPVYGQPKARLLGWSRVGDDLTLLMSGSGSITVKGYFASPDASVDAIVGCD